MEIWAWKDTILTDIDTIKVDTTIRDTTSVENTLSISAQWLYFNFLFETLYLKKEFYIKKRVSFDAPNISMLLGDFYETFGNGLMLGMEPQPAKGYERRINGAKVGAKLGCFELSEVYGTPWVIDRAQQKYSLAAGCDTTDKLLGLNLSAPVSIINTIFSLRGLEFKNQYIGHKTFVGGDIKSSTNWMECTIEGARKMVSDTIFDTTGFGLYCNTKFYVNSYIVGLQIIDYKNFGNYIYHQLPTLNKNEYSINEGRDEFGYQVSLQKSIGDFVGNLSHALISVCNDTGVGKKNNSLEWLPYIPYFSPVDFPWEKKKILEICLDGEFKDFNASLKLLKLGENVDPHYKNKNEIMGEIEGDIKNVKTHLSLTKTQGPPRDISTSLSEIAFYDAGLGIDVLIREGIIVYGTYIKRYTSDSLELKKVERTESSQGDKCYGVGLRVELISRVIGEVWYGKERGGIVCSGGVCRPVNPFEGLKLKLNITL